MALPSATSAEQEDSTRPFVEPIKASLKIRRKPHRKSRNGCARCKRRRIKCDETKPECTRCAEFGILCDYNTAAALPSSDILERPKFIHTRGPRAPRQRGRPRTIWGDEIPKSLSQENESLSLRNTQRFFPETEETFEDFKLLNHFITRTDDSPDPATPLGARDPLHDQALLLSFAYPCILHLIQEFSALELAHHQPAQREKYRPQADRHSAHGLQGATMLLIQFNEANYHAAYTAATFACINYLARGPQPGEYLLFSLNGPSQWLPLLHGIRTVIDLVGIEKIAGGPTERVPEKVNPANEPAKVMLKCPELDWIDQFERLKHLVSSSEDSAAEIDALNKLEQCYQATYGREGGFNGDVNHQNAFIWPYQLGTEFTVRLQAHQPLSLIIAAHFALLIQNYEFIWYMVGWSNHMIAGIANLIDEDFRVWLAWPIEKASLHILDKQS